MKPGMCVAELQMSASRRVSERSGNQGLVSWQKSRLYPLQTSAGLPAHVCSISSMGKAPPLWDWVVLFNLSPEWLLSRRIDILRSTEQGQALGCSHGVCGHQEVLGVGHLSGTWAVQF